MPASAALAIPASVVTLAALCGWMIAVQWLIRLVAAIITPELAIAGFLLVICGVYGGVLLLYYTTTRA